MGGVRSRRVAIRAVALALVATSLLLIRDVGNRWIRGRGHNRRRRLRGWGPIGYGAWSSHREGPVLGRFFTLTRRTRHFIRRTGFFWRRRSLRARSCWLVTTDRQYAREIGARDGNSGNQAHPNNHERCNQESGKQLATPLPPKCPGARVVGKDRLGFVERRHARDDPISARDTHRRRWVDFMDGKPAILGGPRARLASPTFYLFLTYSRK
ncbi:MAG: hypothetical protein JWP10_212 [Nocardioidaceae bacterium]|nr:hypothetical protein [Nocardioidaceae bacterium]